jgi:hypothetical protein
MSTFVKRLIGEDGYVAKGTLGAIVTATLAGGEKVDKDTWVRIVTKASADSIFGELAVGQFYYAPVDRVGEYVGASDLDSWEVLTLEKMVDGISWSVEIAADEIETTVNADRFKQYRRGKLDASGNASFLYISGVTDLPGGLANRFFDIVTISATGVAEVEPADADSIYLVGYLNEGAAKAGENQTVATVMKVELFNFALPSAMGEPGNIDVPFRLVDGNDPVLYTITLPTV